MEGGSARMQTGDSGLERLMDEFLKSKGLYRKKIAKDGSCLFRAVAEQVLRCQSLHTEVRATCVDYLKRNRTKYESFIEGNFEEYLHRLEDPQNWVGEVEISALALIYRHDFIIFQEPGKPPVNITENSFSDKVRLCFLNGNHYDSVYPREFASKAALCQSILYELLYEHVYGVDHGVVSACLRNGDIAGDDGYNECKSSEESDLEEDEEFWSSDAVVPTNMTNQRTSNNNQPSKMAKPQMATLALSRRVQLSLNPALFRNVEYDVWLRSKRAQQKRDFCIAAGMHYTVGDKCKVRLGNAGRFYSAYIQEVTPDHGPVTVFIEELGEKHSIPLWNLRPSSSLDGDSWSTVAEKGKRSSLANGNGHHPGRGPWAPDQHGGRRRGGRGESSPTPPPPRVLKQNSWPPQATILDQGTEGNASTRTRSPDWGRPPSDPTLKSQKAPCSRAAFRKGEPGPPGGPVQEPHFGLSRDERLALEEQQRSQALLEIMQRDERSFPALGSQGGSRAPQPDVGRRSAPQAGERRAYRGKGDIPEMFWDGDNSLRSAQMDDGKLLPGAHSVPPPPPPELRIAAAVTTAPAVSAPAPAVSAPPPAVSAPPPAVSAPPLAASAPPQAASAPPPTASAPPPTASAPPPTASAPPPTASAPPPAASAPPPAASAPPPAASAPSPAVSAPAASAPPPAASAPAPVVSALPLDVSSPTCTPCAPGSSPSAALPAGVPTPPSSSAASFAPAFLTATADPPQLLDSVSPAGILPVSLPVEALPYSRESPCPAGVTSQIGIAPGPPPTPPVLPEHLSHSLTHPLTPSLLHLPSLPHPHIPSPSLPHPHAPSLSHPHTPSLTPHGPLPFHQVTQLFQDPLYPGFPTNDKDEMLSVPQYCYMPNGQDLPREIGILRFFFNLGIKAYTNPSWPPHSYLYQLQQAYMSMQSKVSFMAPWYPEASPPGPFRINSMPMEGYGRPPSYGHAPCPVQPGVGVAIVGGAFGPQHPELGLSSGTGGRPPLGYSPQPFAPLPPHLGGMPWSGPHPNPAFSGTFSTPPLPPAAQYPPVLHGYSSPQLSAGIPSMPLATPTVCQPPAEEKQDPPSPQFPPPPPQMTLYPSQMAPPPVVSAIAGGSEAQCECSTPEQPGPAATSGRNQGPAYESRGEEGVSVARGAEPRARGATYGPCEVWEDEGEEALQAGRSYYGRSWRGRRGYSEGRGYRDARWKGEGRGYRVRRGVDERREHTSRDRRGAENSLGYPSPAPKGQNGRGRGQGYHPNGRDTSYTSSNQRSNAYTES